MKRLVITMDVQKKKWSMTVVGLKMKTNAIYVLTVAQRTKEITPVSINAHTNVLINPGIEIGTVVVVEVAAVATEDSRSTQPGVRHVPTLVNVKMSAT